MSRAKLHNLGLILRSIVLALLVHAAFFALIGWNLSFTKASKPIAQQPMQAMLINEPPLLVIPKEPEPEMEKEPEPESKLVVEKKPKPPKPKPKPKPKEKFKYECESVESEVDTKAEAERLKQACDAKLKAEKENKKKAEEDKAKKELEKKKHREKEKLRQQELKKEQDRKKKETEKKKREQERHNKIAEQKKQAEAERKKSEADQRAKEATLLAQFEGERIQGEKNAAWGAAVSRIKQAVTKEFNLSLFPPGLRAYYIIQLQPGGFVVNVQLERSSGNARYDEEGSRAILKASPLPIPQDSRYFDDIIEYDHSN